MFTKRALRILGRSNTVQRRNIYNFREAEASTFFGKFKAVLANNPTIILFFTSLPLFTIPLFMHKKTVYMQIDEKYGEEDIDIPYYLKEQYN